LTLYPLGAIVLGIHSFAARCEAALQLGEGKSGAKPDSPTALHIAATNQINLALYALHLWNWQSSSRYLSRARQLEHSLRHAAGEERGSQPPVFSGYHCVVFGNMTWEQRLECLHFVAQHVKIRATRPFVALLPRLPLHLLHVAYMSSDFAAHTTGANILGLFRR
jgi:hypothetical protein